MTAMELQGLSEEMHLYEKPYIEVNQFICKQKQIEETYKSSKAVPDQKGVEEGGTKLQSGGVTKEKPQNKEGAQRKKEKERKAKEHLGVGKKNISTQLFCCCNNEKIVT